MNRHVDSAELHAQAGKRAYRNVGSVHLELLFFALFLLFVLLTAIEK